MGMDIYGLQPKDETGKYFRNNYWWWRPLARYCQQVAPEIMAKIKYLESNYGDGLKTQTECNELAAILENAVAANICPIENHLDKEMYPFSFENVLEFAAFLRSCGGFEIN